MQCASRYERFLFFFLLVWLDRACMGFWSQFESKRIPHEVFFYFSLVEAGGECKNHCVTISGVLYRIIHQLLLLKLSQKKAPVNIYLFIEGERKVLYSMFIAYISIFFTKSVCSIILMGFVCKSVRGSYWIELFWRSHDCGCFLGKTYSN